MRSEDQTPIQERYLWLEGKVSNRSLALVQAVLPADKSTNSDIFFVGFSYADLPIGKEFGVVFPKESPSLGVLSKSKIVAVTQQFAKPFQEIPHGWGTICVIEFPEGIPALVQELPVVDAWSISKKLVCLCAQENWDAIKRANSVRQK